MQLRKLAVICNFCFWLMIGFHFWTPARSIQKDLLNTIIVIGMLAVLVNLLWFLVSFKNRSRQKENGQKKAGFTEDDDEADGEKEAILQQWFNALSFVGQLVFFFLKLF